MEEIKIISILCAELKWKSFIIRIQFAYETLPVHVHMKGDLSWNCVDCCALKSWQDWNFSRLSFPFSHSYSNDKSFNLHFNDTQQTTTTISILEIKISSR